MSDVKRMLKALGVESTEAKIARLTGEVADLHADAQRDFIAHVQIVEALKARAAAALSRAEAAERKLAEIEMALTVKWTKAEARARALEGVFLRQDWHKHARIVEGYMPPCPRPETKPARVVTFPMNGGGTWFLRWSRGPVQGYFWDSYGDNFEQWEWAVYALSQAPTPPTGSDHVTYSIPLSAPAVAAAPGEESAPPPTKKEGPTP